MEMVSLGWWYAWVCLWASWAAAAVHVAYMVLEALLLDSRFIKNEEIKFETWTFLDDLVDLSRMRRLSSKQNERMMIEHASRCVFVFYDLLKLLCELLLFKYFKLLKLRNNLHA